MLCVVFHMSVQIGSATQSPYNDDEEDKVDLKDVETSVKLISNNPTPSALLYSKSKLCV